jgi:ornithine cyclodeaminase/alanine dehydrogenase-like protein (mu-crystallin family)
VKERPVVIAIGSHEPDKRELDDALLSRSSIYVESLDSCQREAGDIILALASGAVASPEQLNTLADLVQGLKPRPPGRPAVFKTTGMPWQDLAVAAAAYEAYLCESSDPHDAGGPVPAGLPTASDTPRSKRSLPTPLPDRRTL